MTFHEALTALRTQLQSVCIVHRSGLIDLRAPLNIVRARRRVRKLGPLAAGVVTNAAADGSRIAIVDQTQSLSYSELHTLTDVVANRWENSGISDIDVIAILSPDNWQSIAAAVAAAKVGARTVLVNTGFSARQLADVVAREHVTALVCDDTLRGNADAIGSEVRRLNVAQVTSTHRRVRRRLPHRQGGFVLLTGGTTGTPKGAPRSVVSPLSAAQFVDRVPLRRAQTTLLCAPLFHGTALSQLILATNLCHTIVLLGKFDAARAVEAISAHRCQVVVLVPTMLRRIVDLGDSVLDRQDLRSVEVVFTAGSALPTALGERAASVFGPHIYNFYGSTETGTATIATPTDWQQSPGCVGKPPVGVQIRLYNPDTGAIIDQPGVTGIVHVRNSLSFQGYSDGGNKEVRDGYMSSGDLGHWDVNENLHIDGRSDDMIVSGGENVFPGEIEDLLISHPDVAEAAVFGVDDDDFGQRLAAVITLRCPDSDANPTDNDIKAYVKSHLARFKVPRDVAIIDELPHTAAGKVDRARVRALFTPR